MRLVLVEPNAFLFHGAGDSVRRTPETVNIEMYLKMSPDFLEMTFELKVVNGKYLVCVESALLLGIVIQHQTTYYGMSRSIRQF